MGLFSWFEDKRRDKALEAAAKAEAHEASMRSVAQQKMREVQALQAAQVKRNQDLEDLKAQLMSSITHSKHREWSSEHPKIQLHSIRDGDVFRSGYFVIEGEDDQDCVELVVPMGTKASVEMIPHQDGSLFFDVFCLDHLGQQVYLLCAVPTDYEKFRNYQLSEAVSELDVEAAKAALAALGGD
jgi:hypothetical protein